MCQLVEMLAAADLHSFWPVPVSADEALGCVVGWNLGMGIFWSGRGRRRSPTSGLIGQPSCILVIPHPPSWPLLKGDPKNLIGIDGLNPCHYILKKDNGYFFCKIAKDLFVNSGICQVGLSKLSNREYPAKTLTLDPQLWFSKILAGTPTFLWKLKRLECSWGNANMLNKCWEKSDNDKKAT